MRKSLIILLTLLTAVFLVACGNDTAEEADQPEVEANGGGNEIAQGEDDEPEDTIEVDKGLFNVEVTFPASFLDEEMNMEEIDAQASELGISDVTVNDNGSITYKMSRSTHKNWLRETAEELDKSLREMAESDDLISIKDIFANKNYSEFNMIVDKEAFENSFDGMATIVIGLSGAYYQVLEGADPDNYDVTINIVDEATGQTIDTVLFPDDLSAE